MKCKRCEVEFEPPDDKTNVCATCGDDLRMEEQARIASDQYDTDIEAIEELKKNDTRKPWYNEYR